MKLGDDPTFQEIVQYLLNFVKKWNDAGELFGTPVSKRAYLGRHDGEYNLIIFRGDKRDLFTIRKLLRKLDKEDAMD